MRASDVTTFGYAETMAGVSSRFSFATATTGQQLKNSSNTENTVKSNNLWLSVWRKWCLEKGIAEEIENYEQTQPLTLCSSDSTPKLKANMIKPRKRRFHFIESDSVFSQTLNFLYAKDVKISLYIIVLIIRGCFDRTHGLNQLFFHLMRALCFCKIMISYLVFFHVCYWYVITWFFSCNLE